MFIRDCWYVIAWDHEVPEDGLFARTVMGEPIVLFRDSAGRVAALEDRCCHRHAPLSRGRREDGAVRCGYHGLKFDATGRCIEIPGQATISPQAQVRSYPIAVHNKWIFVWMGDPARVDMALLPNNFSNDDPGWRYRPGYLHYNTDYLLICDNLLDFSHLSYVHEKTLGGTTAIAQAKPTITPLTGPGPRGLRIERRVPNVPPPPYYLKLRSFGGNVDRWFNYDFIVPGTLLMSSGGRPAGQAEDDLTNTIRLHSCQTLTPETAHSTHYFFQQAHEAHLGEDAMTEALYSGVVAAFHEDQAMIRAQYDAIARDPSARMLPITADAALNQFRALVKRTIDAERTRISA
jgi:phenylpropionate dioxygenase-like ring-hydroxylating dioxygenase large terminal subunit